VTFELCAQQSRGHANRGTRARVFTTPQFARKIAEFGRAAKPFDSPAANGWAFGYRRVGSVLLLRCRTVLRWRTDRSVFGSN